MSEPISHNPNHDIIPVEKSEKLDIYGGQLGFTYTIDRGLPGVLQYGLLSRLEERKRGLQVRVRESRSIANSIYFSTLANDVYARSSLDEPKTTDELMEDVVGIAIDRPDYAKKKDGHFGVEDFVEPDKFKSLVFIDQHATPTGKSQYGVPAFSFRITLGEEKIRARVEVLREMCATAGRDIPIHGISGIRYWPPESVEK